MGQLVAPGRTRQDPGRAGRGAAGDPSTAGIIALAAVASSYRVGIVPDPGLRSLRWLYAADLASDIPATGKGTQPAQCRDGQRRAVRRSNDHDGRAWQVQRPPAEPRKRPCRASPDNARGLAVKHG